MKVVEDGDTEHVLGGEATLMTEEPAMQIALPFSFRELYLTHGTRTGEHCPTTETGAGGEVI